MPKDSQGVPYTAIDLGGRVVRLYLRHEHTDQEIPREKHGDRTRGNRFVRITAKTTARLSTEDGDETVEDAAYCSAGDQFRRKTGIRIALTRLLHDPVAQNLFALDKPARTKIWKRVWNIKN